jgi:hypothetical protein
VPVGSRRVGNHTHHLVYAPSRAEAFCRRYSGYRGATLVTEAYRKQPYFAIRSEILDKLQLDPETVAGIEAARPKRQAPGLVTIGYEGKSPEGFLKRVIARGRDNAVRRASKSVEP